MGANENSQKYIRNFGPFVSELTVKTEFEWNKLIVGRNPEKFESNPEMFESDHEEG